MLIEAFRLVSQHHFDRWRPDGLLAIFGPPDLAEEVNVKPQFQTNEPRVTKRVFSVIRRE